MEKTGESEGATTSLDVESKRSAAPPVNHEDFDDIKKNLLEKEGDVNHASFDGVEKKSHVCHHQKGGECECMYT